MILKHPGQLRPVYHAKEFTAPEEGIDIVIVPGVWIEYPPDRFKANCGWLKPLLASTTNDTRVFFFKYELDNDGSSLWQQLLHQSAALLEGLNAARQEAGLEQRPLLFICHSLGGVVVKRALGMAHHSQRTYEDVTSGIIFLGTPHLTDEGDKRWNNFKLLMKANRKDVSKQNLTSDERESLAIVCRRFDDLHLNIPILSVYEGQETKIRENLLQALRGRKTSLLLVDKDLAKTDARNEKLFRVQSTHNDLCHVPVDGPLYRCLVDYFKSFAEAAPANVALAFHKLSTDEAGTQILGSRTSASSSKRASADGDGDNKSLDRRSVTSRNEKDAVKFPLHCTHAITKNPEFFGQSEYLQQMDDALLPTNPTDTKASVGADGTPTAKMPNSFVLCGMGGIGKTELATEYVFSRKQHFDAIFWIYADTAHKIGDQFIQIARELGSHEDNDVAAREVVKAWLAHPEGLREGETEMANSTEISWLLVFDNADDADLLFDWLPTEGLGSILVTSRDPYTKEGIFSRERGADLSTLSINNGASLLRKLSRRENEPDALERSLRIATFLGGLPLAISQMSAIIRRKHLTLKDFEGYYQENSKKLHSMKFQGDQSRYSSTVWTTWAVEQLSASARAILNVLSVMDPDRIPEDLLRKGAKNVNLDDYPRNQSDYFEARAELLHSSLIKKNMATDELGIHRLVQDVLRERMSADQLHVVFASTAILLTAVWPFVTGTDPTRNQAWRIPVAQKYSPHIRRLVTLFSPEIRAGDYNGTIKAASVFSSYAWFISERGHPDQTEVYASLAQIILEAAQNAGKGDEKEITGLLADCHHNRSFSALYTESPGGMDHAKKWLEILLWRIEKWHLTEDALALATAYNQIALCYVKDGNDEEAIKSWQLSLDSYRNMESAPKLSGVWPATSLALMYVLLGRAQEADNVLTPILGERNKVLGKDDETTSESGAIWRAMGNIRNAQQKYDEALSFHQRALRNYKKTLGDMHYMTGDCNFALGVDLLRKDEKQKALDHFESAILAFGNASYRQAQAARALWKKGHVLRSLNSSVEGDALINKAMEIRKEIAPDDGRPEEELKDEDWDRLIFYFSR